MDCIFCRIIAHQAPARILFENDGVIVFQDHRPQAPTHLQVCPKTHYASFLETPPDEVACLLAVCRQLAETLGVQDGFRIIINNGPQAGQMVFHLHIHFISWLKEPEAEKIAQMRL